MKKTVVLFDVDGTLTKPRQVISPSVLEFLLTKVLPVCTVGLVGGSDLSKIAEQMGGMDVLDKLDYVFAENGLLARKKGVEIGRESIVNSVGEEKLQKFINYCLGFMSTLSLPCKRGTFIEFRNGLINICPVGRSCSQAEREEFYEFDKQYKIRENFISALEEKFPNYGLKYSIGGQISIDVFPIGWDKTYCLRFLEESATVHFFGDKTHEGGNDHEIFIDSRTIGHTVVGPEDTLNQLRDLLNIQY